MTGAISVATETICWALGSSRRRIRAWSWKSCYLQHAHTAASRDLCGRVPTAHDPVDAELRMRRRIRCDPVRLELGVQGKLVEA